MRVEKRPWLGKKKILNDLTKVIEYTAIPKLEYYSLGVKYKDRRTLFLINCSKYQNRIQNVKTRLT